MNVFAFLRRSIENLVRAVAGPSPRRATSGPAKPSASPTVRILGHFVLVPLLVAFLAISVQSVFSPIAVANTCGAGQEVCSSTDHAGYDRFCFDYFWFFKFCYNVTYYHPDDPGCDGVQLWTHCLL